LVDEYQDTNRAQYIAVNLLAKAHQNLCVVGDDAQSIYRWRGADIQNILDFQKDYPYSKTVKLERNYRSTKTILSAADSVIKHNRKQLQKKLWTDNETGELIDVFECQNEKEEALRVTDIIKKHHKKGIKLGDMALLYRTNAQSLTLENSLRHANIPYLIVGGISFYKRKEIKDVVAYLRLIINPADNEAVNRVVNEPPRGLGQTSLKHIKYYASKNKLTLLQAFEKAKNITDLQPRAVKSCEEFAQLVNKYIKKVNDTDPDDLVKELLEEVGYIGMYKEIETEESKDRLNNVEQLIIDIGEFFIENPEAKLEEYLQQISLSSDMDNKEFADEKLTMMTIHSAKGLEFKLVCVTGLEEGLFPLKRQDSHPDEEEEERRLFYVAITRAKEKLYLLYATNRARYGSYGTQSPSGFIREIDSKLLLWDGRQKVDRVMIKNPAFPAKNVQIAKKPVNEYSQIQENDNYSQLPGNSGLRIGDRVRHSQFGPGKIVNISGAGMTQKADVNFDSIGRKSLLIQYAKLQKI
jgi:DNA helicase-2/ATP-dependent DNA helicase PcrA